MLGNFRHGYVRGGRTWRNGKRCKITPSHHSLTLACVEEVMVAVRLDLRARVCGFHLLKLIAMTLDSQWPSFSSSYNMIITKNV